MVGVFGAHGPVNGRRAWLSRALLAALAAGLGAALLPGAALAHATLVSSNPSPGQRLGAAPGAVDLQFSEPVRSRLSTASVQAPDGRTYTAVVAASGRVEPPL